MRGKHYKKKVALGICVPMLVSVCLCVGGVGGCGCVHVPACTRYSAVTSQTPTSRKNPFHIIKADLKEATNCLSLCFCTIL